MLYSHSSNYRSWGWELECLRARQVSRWLPTCSDRRGLRPLGLLPGRPTLSPRTAPKRPPPLRQRRRRSRTDRITGKQTCPAKTDGWGVGRSADAPPISPAPEASRIAGHAPALLTGTDQKPWTPRMPACDPKLTIPPRRQTVLVVCHHFNQCLAALEMVRQPENDANGPTAHSV